VVTKPRCECLRPGYPPEGSRLARARATVEAMLATLAAPGMRNPDDEAPVLDGPVPEETARRYMRSEARRNHDALNAGCEK
jgi:hypothetical protein